MARHQFGGGLADWVYLENSSNIPVLQGNVPLTFWTARTGGGQLSDLSNNSSGSSPITLLTTSDGDDGYRIGVIPVFYGPDGVTQMWASADNGERQVIVANDLGDDVADAILKTVVLAKGDLIVGTSSGNVARLPRGADGTVLTVDSAQTSGLRYATPVGGGGGGVSTTSDILWVAAADAPAQFADAPYVCDGTADQVQIQTALDNAIGLRVGLSPGTFNLTAPVLMYGSDNSAAALARHLHGSGRHATRIIVGSGVNGGIFFGKVVSPTVTDLTVEVVGNSHGIYSSLSSTPAANNRSFVNGTVNRCTIKGPGSGNNTGWGMSLGSAYKCSVEDVEITGMSNGVRVLNESSTFNAGQCRFARVAVDLTGNSGIGFQVNSPSGNANQIEFDTCYAVMASASTGTTGWAFVGAGASSGVRVRNCTSEFFDTAVSIAATAFDVDIDLCHATVPTAGVFATVAGYACRVRAGRLYVPTSATVSAITETNSYATKPNTFDLDIYADTSSTVTATLTTGVVTRGVADGPGTVATTLVRKPSTGRVYPFTKGGALATGAGTFAYTNDTGNDMTLRSARSRLGTAGATGSTIVDVNINGVTVFPTQANRPTIATTGTTSGKVTTQIAGTPWPNGATLSVDIDTIGGGSPADLFVQVDTF